MCRSETAVAVDLVHGTTMIPAEGEVTLLLDFESPDSGILEIIPGKASSKVVESVICGGELRRIETGSPVSTFAVMEKGFQRLRITFPDGEPQDLHLNFRPMEAYSERTRIPSRGRHIELRRHQLMTPSGDYWVSLFEVVAMTADREGERVLAEGTLTSLIDQRPSKLATSAGSRQGWVMVDIRRRTEGIVGSDTAKNVPDDPNPIDDEVDPNPSGFTSGPVDVDPASWTEHQVTARWQTSELTTTEIDAAVLAWLADLAWPELDVERSRQVRVRLHRFE